MRRLIAIAILVVGCAAPAASAPPSQAPATVAPTVVSTAAPAAAPTARPTAESAAVRQTGHITLLVKSLMSKSDPQEIMAWIDNENQWLSEQANLPIVSDYRATVEAAAYDLRSGGKQNVIERHALEIIAAAREVPGVTLP